MAIWEMSESFEELLPFLRCEIPSFFKNKQRNLEWISSRILLQQVIDSDFKLSKDEYGKPFLENEKSHISLTHCSKYTAAIVSDKPTGIDIEHINERIHRISDRFMNQKEKDSTPDKDDTLYKYLIWCAKEAVYKLYGRKAVDFSTHMNVLPFSISKTGKLTLEFTKKNLLRFEVNYMILEDHALAWVEA